MRGIQRSNRKRVSRVPPRSFGPMVHFLEKLKNRDLEHFQDWPKIAPSVVWSHMKSQYVSYDPDTSDLPIRAICNAPKIFAKQNS